MAKQMELSSADVVEGSNIRIQAPVEDDLRKHGIHIVLRGYLDSLRSIRETAGIVLPHLAGWMEKEIAGAEKLIDHYMPAGIRPDGIEFENARDFVEFSGALQKWDRLQEDRSLPLLSRSLFMQLFCEFDAFTGNLLKQVYLKNFDLLKGISREISLVDLLECKDIESASHAMLEKEIESFRRDSYIEQFAQLEKKFSLQLRKFPEWPQFVEFSQRRNLFAHNDGIVSDQYIAVCRREGCALEDDVAVGVQLSVSPVYLANSLRVMSKIGYMLTHTLWRKIFPKEVEKVHDSLNAILYDCLEEKRWRTAADIGEFALTEPMKRELKEVDLRVRLVNTAIAKKFSGDEAGAHGLLASVDWTASYRDFKLALLVLHDRFDEAITLMREIGKSGEMLGQSGYHTWPLFERFREREEFYAVYEEIYGEPYKAESGDIAARVAAEAKKKRASVRKKSRREKAAKAAGEA